MDVTVTPTTVVDRHVVTNMFTAYFYDMSQYDPELIINDPELPRWSPANGSGLQTRDQRVLFNWWLRDSCELYIIRADNTPIGFVIICANAARLPDGVEFEMMDFYIAPNYRRQGVGRRAARAALDLHHGTWVVYQLDANTPARCFWQQVLSDYTGGRFENLDGGTQQRFRN